MVGPSHQYIRIRQHLQLCEQSRRDLLPVFSQLPLETHENDGGQIRETPTTCMELEQRQSMGRGLGRAQILVRLLRAVRHQQQVQLRKRQPVRVRVPARVRAEVPGPVEAAKRIRRVREKARACAFEYKVSERGRVRDGGASERSRHVHSRPAVGDERRGVPADVPVELLVHGFHGRRR